jgi:hypothetical protein
LKSSRRQTQFIRLYLPQSSISRAAFYECSHLAKGVFDPGSALSKIGEEAFQGFAALESICVPRLLEVLEARCFPHCGCLLLIDFEVDSHPQMICVAAFQN